MKVDLIYQDSSSNKFWSIEVNKNEHTVTYGRVGTDGTSKTKSFADEEESLKQANKLVAAKKKKGYEEVSKKQQVVRDNHTFAGKPIKEFGSTFNINTAIKVLAQTYDAEESLVDKLDKLVKTKDSDKIDTLVIGSWEDAYDVEAKFILDKLIELKAQLKSLKHLFIGDMDGEECEMSWIMQTDYSDFYKHFPNLESFGVKGGQNLQLGVINLPKLKNLVIETGGLNKEVIEGICKSNLPSLEHLEIWLGTEDYGCNIKIADLKPILQGKFPNLKYLGLKNYHLMDDLAVALKDAPIISTLKTLDISMGILKDTGAKALYENDDLLKLDHLNCRYHFISEEWISKLKSKFSNQNINLDDNEKQYEGDEEWFYVEIGE